MNPSTRLTDAEIAVVGDWIECDLTSYGHPKKMTAELSTPDACIYGNYLISTGRWKKVVKKNRTP